MTGVSAPVIRDSDVLRAPVIRDSLLILTLLGMMLTVVTILLRRTTGRRMPGVKEMPQLNS
jgi:hypothetical protein